jgi:hypothetical protein
MPRPAGATRVSRCPEYVADHEPGCGADDAQQDHREIRSGCFGHDGFEPLQARDLLRERVWMSA